MLSSADIRAEVLSEIGEIYLSPFREENLQPASVDLTLGGEIIRLNHGNEKRPLRAGACIKPGEFILGSTEEVLGLSLSMAARFEGKSSLGRLGLLTHVSAGFIDPGFRGTITVEIVNLSSREIWLEEGMKIGQVCFFRLDSPTPFGYGSRRAGSHYQGQQGPTLSALVGDQPPLF